MDTTKYPPREYFIRFKDAILALLMPFIILGGIYAGIFTPPSPPPWPVSTR